MKDLGLTKEQITAAKKVYAAMRKAHKLGIDFWDNYGTLSCYNNKKIKALRMDSGNGKFNRLVSEDYYYELLQNFFAGNADDPIYVEEI